MSVSVEKVYELKGHKEAIYTLCGAGESAFFSAGADGAIMYWDLQEDNPGQFIIRLPHSIYSLLYLAHENVLLAGSSTGALHVIDLAQKKEVFQLKLQGAVFRLGSIAAKGLLIATCGNGFIYSLQIADYSVGEITRPCEDSIRALGIHPAGDRFATGSSDQFIRTFDLDLRETDAFPAHDNSVFSLAYTPNGKYLLSGGRDAQLKVWDTETLHMVESLPAHLYTINDIQWAGKQPYFFTASRDKSVKVWDGKTLALLKVIDRSHYAAHSHSVNSIHWQEHTNILLSAGDDRSIYGWKVNFLSEEE